MIAPTLGRFLQRDPNATAMPLLEANILNGQLLPFELQALELLNLYAYGTNIYPFARSSPTNWADPLGLWANDVIGGSPGFQLDSNGSALGYISSFVDQALFGAGFYWAAVDLVVTALKDGARDFAFDFALRGVSRIGRAMYANVKGGKGAEKIRAAADKLLDLVESRMPIDKKQVASTARKIAEGLDIDDVQRLVKEHGGEAKNWQKMKGWDVDGTEWHWYQNLRDGIGKVEFKVKS